jgi:hypothetical protein
MAHPIFIMRKLLTIYTVFVLFQLNAQGVYFSDTLRGNNFTIIPSDTSLQYPAIYTLLKNYHLDYNNPKINQVYFSEENNKAFILSDQIIRGELLNYSSFAIKPLLIKIVKKKIPISQIFYTISLIKIIITKGLSAYTGLK